LVVALAIEFFKLAERRREVYASGDSRHNDTSRSSASRFSGRISSATTSDSAAAR